MAEPIVFGPWSGAITSNSAVVKVAVSNQAAIRLLLSETTGGNGDLVNTSSHNPQQLDADSRHKVAGFFLENLKPDTQYHYAIEVNNVVVQEKLGRFKTFPPEDDPFSFRFVCAGDADTGSNEKVFEFILEEAPLFFCHLGDLHYENVHEANTIKYREAYAAALNARRQADLYRNIPIVYTWDDHDFDNNGANSTAPGRKTARLAYQQCVPHYPLVEGKGNVAIYQGFTVGRVRFLISDTRSERTPNDEDDNAQKTMLGVRQKQWLKDELLAGRDKYPLVVWVSSVPWIGKKKKRADSWFGYATERDEIGAFIEDNQINNVCMLAADAHMLAIDDGRNNSGEFGRGRFPVFQAAPLDSTRSVKGGPFLLGPFIDDSGQYGVFTVEDTGGSTVRVTLEGKNVNEGSTLLTHQFESPRS